MLSVCDDDIKNDSSIFVYQKNKMKFKKEMKKCYYQYICIGSMRLREAIHKNQTFLAIYWDYAI